MMVRVIALLSLLANPVSAQTGAVPQTQAQIDELFLRYLAADNEAEIRLAQNAQKATQSSAVAELAQLVLNDATNLKNGLGLLLQQNKITVPPQMTEREASKVAPKTVSDFDASFVAAVINHDTNDLLRFKNEQSSTHDDAIRKFVADAVPILQQHLARAREVQTSLANRSTNVR